MKKTIKVVNMDHHYLQPPESHEKLKASSKMKRRNSSDTLFEEPESFLSTAVKVEPCDAEFNNEEPEIFLPVKKEFNGDETLMDPISLDVKTEPQDDEVKTTETVVVKIEQPKVNIDEPEIFIPAPLKTEPGDYDDHNEQVQTDPISLDIKTEPQDDEMEMTETVVVKIEQPKVNIDEPDIFISAPLKTEPGDYDDHNESTKASSTEVLTITSRKKKEKKTNAQRCKEYRERQKLKKNMVQNVTAERSDECSETDQLPAKKPKTNAERRKKHYEAQKLKKQKSKKIPKTAKQRCKEYYYRKKRNQALNTLNHHSDADEPEIFVPAPLKTEPSDYDTNNEQVQTDPISLDIKTEPQEDEMEMPIETQKLIKPGTSKHKERKKKISRHVDRI